MASKEPTTEFRTSKMDHKSRAGATPYQIHFDTEKSPGHTYVEGLRKGSADKVSELLMLNHAQYHIVFNEVGLHNHIVHHLCSLWALGASPSELQAAYDLNKAYQLPHYHHGVSDALKMKDPNFFKEGLGVSENYTDYLQFFQDEIAMRGVEDVVKEYLFRGDERADDLLGRLHSGFEHPILHLGFGLEFNQPCLVAEALASACVHDDWPLPIVLPVEKYIVSTPNLPSTSMHSVLQALQSDPVIRNAVKPNDPPNRVTSGLIPRVGTHLPPLLAKWRVQPTQADIEYRMAEMVHVCTYILGAAQHPRKEPSIDFFMMHSTNLSVFYPTFLRLEWLSLEQKARLLTWKGWMDMAIYAACGCPTLYPERITNYVPIHPGPWSSIIARATRYPDDGHTVKLIRAIVNAENMFSPSYHHNPDFPMKPGDFLQMAHMTMDSVERMLRSDYKLPENMSKSYVGQLGLHGEVVKIVTRFVRWCGVEGAWDDIPDLKEGTRAKL